MRSEERAGRFALAALAGFFAGLVSLPVACGGFVLVNEHRLGSVESGGPAAVLGGMGVAFGVGIVVFGVVWWRGR